MIGAADIGNCLQDNGDFDDLAGITPRAVSELFRLLVERTAQIDFNVEVSMFQVCTAQHPHTFAHLFSDLSLSPFPAPPFSIPPHRNASPIRSLNCYLNHR